MNAISRCIRQNLCEETLVTDWLAVIKQQTAGTLLINQSLADYTSWRAGGAADFVYIPQSVQDLGQFLRLTPDSIPVTWLGLGSNTLIRDGGLAGVVIITQGKLRQLKHEGTQVSAEAGLSCAQVARYAARQGLAGVEFLAGVPGTFGGALAMNAGCFGGETWQYVKGVEMMTRQGNIIYRQANEFNTRYRFVERPPNEWFISGVLQLSEGDKQQSLEAIRELLDRRAATQPTNEPSCGSVFRNPEGDHSARLIEACQLKGVSVGDASVSTKHANFIVNNGQATAQDIETLINQVQQQVQVMHGVSLIPEVHVIGQASDKESHR